MPTEASSLLLALETSTLAGSIALARNGHILETAQLSAARRKTGELLPAIRDLFAQSDCHPRETNIVAFSSGPGSFTGLRTGTTIARMFRLAANAQVVSVSSLAAAAAGALDLTANQQSWLGPMDTLPPDDARIGVLLDARGGLYFGAVYQVVANEAYDDDIPMTSRLALRPIDSPAARPLAEWIERFPRPIVLTGEGLNRCASDVLAPGAWLTPASQRSPTATAVAQIGAQLARAGRFCGPHEVVPQYIRPPECEEVFELRKAAARLRRDSARDTQ